MNATAMKDLEGSAEIFVSHQDPELTLYDETRDKRTNGVT